MNNNKNHIIGKREYKDKIKNSEEWAGIYIRVSTDAQAEEGYSIDAQKEQLIAYCVSKGIKNYKLYIDGGWSGSNIDRPEMQKLIQDAKDGKLTHCIVYKLDRLSRSQKDTLYLIEDVFNPHGVNFISLNESLETESALGRAMIGILSAFAQLERENIRMRTRMGMKERVKSGLWMGGGRIPFGYDYDAQKGILVQNKDAEKVKQIYSLYIQGYSPQKIANMLGLKYDRLAIQILKRKSNYGIIEYNGEEYQGLHEPIISKETYDTAMQIMINRSITTASNSEHLLTGLIYCGKCGAKMRYQKWGKNGYKFVCYSQQKSKPYLVKDPDCDQEKHWCDEVEDVVVKILFELKEKVQNKEITYDNENNSVLDILNKEYSDLERKIRRLYNLYAESEDDILLETIKENNQKLKKIKDNIEAETKHRNLTRERNKVTDSIVTLSDTWNYMTVQEKQNIVRILVKKVVITDDNIDVILNI